MSILGKIISTIFGHAGAAPAGTPAAPAAPSAPAAAPSSVPASPAAKPATQVDVAGVLTKLAAKSKESSTGAAQSST